MEKKRVLVIDDEETIRDLLQIFLEENECEAVTEGVAEDGLAQLRTNSFDLVLLDIMLGDTDGLQVLQQIKKISPDISVIMITGNHDIELAQECLANGATDYISKPFDFDYLRESVLVTILV